MPLKIFVWIPESRTSYLGIALALAMYVIAIVDLFGKYLKLFLFFSCIMGAFTKIQNHSHKQPDPKQL